MKNEILYPVRVISGKYKGREGKLLRLMKSAM